MNSDRNRRTADIIRKLLRNTGFYKIILLLSMGYMIMFTDVFGMFLNSNIKKYGLGAAFFVYSIIRGIIVYRLISREE